MILKVIWKLKGNSKETLILKKADQSSKLLISLLKLVGTSELESPTPTMSKPPHETHKLLITNKKYIFRQRQSSHLSAYTNQLLTKVKEQAKQCHKTRSNYLIIDTPQD